MVMPRRKNNPHATSAKEPARDVNRTQRQLQAIELRKQGMQWQEIAERCGIAGGKAGAYKLVNQALKARLRETTDDYRELMTQRLEALWALQWRKAVDEHNKASDWAVDRLLQIHDRLERLHAIAVRPDHLQAQAQMVVIGIPQDVLEAV
jgi:hypothetical protein